MLARGERDCVLECLRRCRAIWPGHEDEIDLWALQIQRGDPCAFERSGFVVPKMRKKAAAKPTPAADEDALDDRDSASLAFVAGLEADDEQALDWAAKIQRNPEDVESRAGWLGWASQIRRKRQVDPDHIREHLEWLVLHKPEHPSAATPRFRSRASGTMDSPAISTNSGSCRRHESTRLHAYSAMRRATSGRSIDRSRSPFSRERLRWSRANRSGGQSGVHSADDRTVSRDSAGFDERFDTESCERALAESERAYELSHGSPPDLSRLDTHMKAAAGANRWIERLKSPPSTCARSPARVSPSRARP
jgi:hypothetical protein